MIKALKRYWAFTNGIYKLVMLVMLPIVFIIINIISSSQEYGNGLLSVMLLFVIDILSDIFFLSGIYKRDNSALKFLQSSPKFSNVIKDITIIDMVRRGGLYHIPLVVTWVCSVGDTEKQTWCVMDSFLTWLIILIAQIVVLMARHYVMWNQVYACTMIGWGTAMLFILLIKISKISITVINAILVVLILIASIATIRYTDKKIRESYYDK